MDPKKAGAAGQGLGGQNQSQSQNQSPEPGRAHRPAAGPVRAGPEGGIAGAPAAGLGRRRPEREKSNNPATREQRQSYDKNAPGMNPANQPAPDTKLNKGTRLDLEDITGNPGHRGVNPDAPANSINRGAPYDDSINEPHRHRPELAWRRRAGRRAGRPAVPGRVP